MTDDDLNLVDLMQDDRFRSPLAAAEWLEGVRWPNGPVCPHCGNDEKHYRLKHQTRLLRKCAKCRKQFTVTVGTIFESSHVGLDRWLLAFYLLCSSKKGMSAHQLHRSLSVTYKTAWFMFHRVREAMRDPAFTSRLTGTVEADETNVGGKRKNTKRGGRPGPKDKNKAAVFALVERGGRARSFHFARVTAEELQGAIHQLKRGVNGVYHRISPAHLHRYLNEFDFRYNTRTASDGGRLIAALKQAEGKRLMYRDSR